MTDWAKAKVYITREIQETHEISYDQNDYVEWLDGAAPDDENLAEFIESDEEWLLQFSDSTLKETEYQETTLNSAEAIDTNVS